MVGSGEVVPHVAFDALGTVSSGWAVDHGVIVVRHLDSFGVVRITIER